MSCEQKSEGNVPVPAKNKQVLDLASTKKNTNSQAGIKKSTKSAVGLMPSLDKMTAHDHREYDSIEYDQIEYDRIDTPSSKAVHEQNPFSSEEVQPSVQPSVKPSARPLVVEKIRHDPLFFMPSVKRAEYEDTASHLQVQHKEKSEYRPLYPFEVRQIDVVRQKKDGDCGLHVIANAQSVNECLKEGISIEDDYIQDYHGDVGGSGIYRHGLKILQSQGKGHVIHSGLSNMDIMSLAKHHFKMDNCCLIYRDRDQCHTTEQPLADLERGVISNEGPATDNSSIHTMMHNLKDVASGAVHFVFGINNSHWVEVSVIKENDGYPYIAYMDSNNDSLANQPDAHDCINFIRDNYGYDLV